MQSTKADDEIMRISFDHVLGIKHLIFAWPNHETPTHYRKCDTDAQCDRAEKPGQHRDSGGAEMPDPCEGIPIGAVVGTQAEKKAILEASGQGSEGQRIAWWHPICEQS